MAKSAAIAKINPVHQQLADWLLAEGGTTRGWNRKAADKFGYTQAWISTIYHSDAFQDYYNARAAEFGKTAAAGLADKINGLAGQAIDALAERLETQGDTLPISQVIAIADLATKRAGFGDGGPQAPQIQQNFMISSEQLEAARSKMRGKQVEAVIELKPVRDPSQGSDTGGS